MDSPQRPIEYASPDYRVRRPPPPGSSLRLALYLCLGNVWLLVALALYVGRTYERSAPAMYSVFGIGRWFSAGEYFVVQLVPAAIGAAFLFLAGRQAMRVTPEP